MTAQLNLSTTSKNILVSLFAANMSSKEVADRLNVKLPVVTGSLAGLKKNGFVEVSDGKLVATEAAKVAMGVTIVSSTVAKKGDRKAAAVAILKSMPAGSSRKDIMARFMTELNMSSAQASTYHYNLTGARGMWNV